SPAAGMTCSGELFRQCGIVPSMSIQATVARPTTKLIRRGTERVLGSDATCEVGNEPVTIGRDPGCRLVLDDPEVSAVHLELSADERGIRVRDVDSLNGTYVGDVRISEVHLTSPQRVRVGSVSLEIAPGPEQELSLS